MKRRHVSYASTTEHCRTVTVLSSNLWAAVEIGGNQHLNTGDNLVTIDVTAQNGINHMHYVVHVVRRESNIPENSSLVDLEGKTYTFLDPPEDAKVPDGFYPAMKIINGYSVPVFVKDGVSSVILFLYDILQMLRPEGMKYMHSLEALTAGELLSPEVR